METFVQLQRLLVMNPPNAIKTFYQPIAMKAITVDEIHLERPSNVRKILVPHEVSRRDGQKELEKSLSRILEIIFRG